MKKTLKSGTIKRLHVDKHVIASNAKHGLNNPPLTVQTSKGPLKAHTIEINGSSKMVYSPDKPLKCGARLWIETKAEVVLKG